MYYRPRAASQIVGIGESTLRAWSHQFASLLSEGARPGIQTRRYNDRDLAILSHAKVLLNAGQTFDQAHAQMTAELGSVNGALLFVGDSRRVADLEAQIELLQLLLAAKDEVISSLRAQLRTAWADFDTLVQIRASSTKRR